MAATGLLALLDDITTLLDDVAVYSKVAVKKSAGVLGDDLALNAEQVSGVDARRELPVVWAVARGYSSATRAQGSLRAFGDGTGKGRRTIDRQCPLPRGRARQRCLRRKGRRFAGRSAQTSSFPRKSL